MSDFVERLSLKYLDTETTGGQCIIYRVVATRWQCKSTAYVIEQEAALSLFEIYAVPSGAKGILLHSQVL